MTWRKDSGLTDGFQVANKLFDKVDLVGGYYDAGDNVKFNFPMAFSTTMLAWSVIEFGKFMGPSDLNYALDTIRWATDYLLKATSIPGSVFAVVGDPNADHSCWERPEDMDTPRTAYAVTKQLPGSELSAEIAAALAASSIVFRKYHLGYSARLLQRARMVFDFADKYRGSYNDSLGPWVCPFYCDYSGYQFLLNSSTPNPFIPNADKFVCTVLPESPTLSVSYSPGGLLFKSGGSNLQHATAYSFLFLVYAAHLNKANREIHCGGEVAASPGRLIQFARGQVDYILGNNPLKMSYMVGYGPKFPQRIHHRASSLPSLGQHPGHMDCKGGSSFYETQNPNPNLLLGAVVGGPDLRDSYSDSRPDFVHSEPTTYINAPLVGALAYFKAH